MKASFRIKFTVVAALTAVVGCAFADNGIRAGFADRLPPGSIRPQGYLLRQMELQRDGLTGHAERLYDDIGQSDWLTQAGRGGEFAWERGPYYAKGLVSLAFALNDAGLKEKAARWVDAIVASQRENGDFGPKDRNWWANMIALWLLRDWQEATGDMRIVPFLVRYFDYQRTEFSTYPLPAESKWAQARAGDELDVVLWLYRKTKSGKWLDFARSVASQSADWATYYRYGGDGAKEGYRSHIVNFMQGLKTPALCWLLDGSEANRMAYGAAFSPDGYLMRRCGRPDRMLNGSEPLTDRSASGGTELCAIAERILSSHVQLSVFGDAEVADDLEMIAYNSLPATLSGDGKGVRYYLMLNQPSCIDKALLFANNGFGAQVTGATCSGPHSGFGCCRSNFHLAWPKFVEAMWMAREGGLAAVAYGDCTVTTPVATIVESGGYPFSDNVNLTVEKTQGGVWPLFVRIPRWCSDPEVRVNGELCQLDAVGGFRRIVRKWRAGDKVSLHFPSDPVASFWANDAVCIRRGALLYALPVEGRTKLLTRYQVPYEKRKAGERESGFPRREIQATSPWNYALVMQPGGREPVMETTGSRESLRIRVRAVQTTCGGWGSMRPDAPGRPEDPPHSPVSAHDGSLQWLTLAPIGFTQTRITLFPWVESSSESAQETVDCRPQTWFHMIGGNVSRAGLTADLEAVKAAGIGGIQFFHGRGARWDGVENPIQCLGPQWDGLVRFTAAECERLQLSFRMQNCPGWSMSGGPWIAPSNAMRKLAFSRRDFTNGVFDAAIPVPEDMRDPQSDWHDIATLAFPTPADDTGACLAPETAVSTGGVLTFSFAEPVTVRTIELPSPSQLCHSWSYNPNTRVKMTAHADNGPTVVCEADYPQGCWQDSVPFTLACEEAVAKKWTIELSAPHSIKVPYARLLSAPRMENWEGKSGLVLRGFVVRRPPVRRRDQTVAMGNVREVAFGDRLGAGRWTVLRIGHVNAKKKNGPAPAEATGWECDKLDPRGADANFAGYIGRLISDVLPRGSLKGMLIDSWECERQNWTWRMEEYFRAHNGYDVKCMLPALFGWIVDDEAKTDAFLLDWRRTIGELICRNYYGRMAELARAHGLDVTWETALGDVVPGDILAYWKDCDVPMCEFWHPATPATGHVGHRNFKPVKPCVSAAHLYGKRRVAAEAFTSINLTWNESLRELKETAVRYLSQGITHFVFHTYTHNPHTDGRVPGTSFGSFIGSPFLRSQTWWSFMPGFTGWLAECGRFLERGHPVVDVLRYLGDDVGHKPDELEPFPAGYICDYLNQDVLLTRLAVKNGVFVLPNGLGYSRIWIPSGTVLAPKTRERLETLAAQGGVIVYGDATDAVKGLPPQVASEDCGPLPESTARDLMWYHRREGMRDLYFMAAETNGFKGTVSVLTANGAYKVLSLELAPSETACITIDRNGVAGLPTASLHAKTVDISTGWKLAFPAGWGAPTSLPMDGLCAWKDLRDVSDECRAFSGTANYTRTVEIFGARLGRVVLDLGDVRHAARVFVNGREVAALWSSPYRCDIAPFLREGMNDLRIEVASTWHNRLAYDAGRPMSERKTWTVWNAGPRTPLCLKPGAKLKPSGLLGPVKLFMEAKGE